MRRRLARLGLLVAAAVLVGVAGGGAAVRLYTDALWFDSVSYLPVFWTQLGTTSVVRLIATLLGAALVLLNLWVVARQLGPVRVRRRYGNLEIAERVPRGMVAGGAVILALLAGWWISGLSFAGGAPLGVLAWLRRVEWGVTDPLFGRDLSFYVFALPVYLQILGYLLLLVVWSVALAVLGYVLVGAIRWSENRIRVDEGVRLHAIVLLAAMLLLLGVRYWLSRYNLLLEGGGFAGSLGYTDVTARLPARRIMAVLSVLAAAALLYGAWRRAWAPPLLALGAWLGAALGLLEIYPALVQKFRVEPNQLEREAPYIRWNLEFTRRAYGLHELERRVLPYRAAAVPSSQVLAASLSRMPLWDLAPLKTTYNQIQALFGYYQFPAVHYDRYGAAGEEEQVAIAVREFSPQGLPADARTWQTLRLNPQYMRGMGAAVTPVSQTTAQGEPVLWVGNLDPVDLDPAAPAQLELTRPEVYFGETMEDYVVLVPGRGAPPAPADAGREASGPLGVSLGSFPRLLAFAWRFGDKNLLFAGEVRTGGRFLFRRSVGERLATLAPFLLWDPEAYPVIANGRVVWIADGYTAVAGFPLARVAQLRGLGRVRYLRNSVKATVDAFTGAVSFYAVEMPDPVLETYRRIFSGLIQPLAAMPPELRRHLRYPALFLQAQADILETYHLQRPEAFYAGQDVWQMAQEHGAEGLKVYPPIYAMARLPAESQAELLLLLPFIARERQNMTALLVARSDPPHYGEMVLLELPRDQQIPGPGQVQTLIEQDPVISAQLSLWRQAGSNVDLGRLRVVPLDSTFLYLEPLFLSAQGSPIPALHRVVLSDGRAVSMAPTLAEALRALQTGAPEAAPRAAGPQSVAERPPGRAENWPRRALELLEEAERRLRRGDYAGFGASLTELRELLLRQARERP
ncbi:MAG: UPF0182 family protein [Gemmatimonadetes bacterium]|nr:UPF0182 family protein [Gemmatimonadota bacterium]